MIKVVCGIIYKKDKILLCRKKKDKNLGGLWEFPGGKIELNEIPEKALTRELIEELGMHVKILNHFSTTIHNYETFSVKLLSYKCDFIKASFELTDHDKYEWLNLSELSNKKIVPADIKIINKLKQG
ncbi:(deoxy)nucleoside triphosphate pyrophosphohydrolase [Tenacibaculum jejuense]|uniref:8-oxo-dGTP diphosphatase n=1 Tax=Tenacibaculum jejuense TaxID=584609 RepID=A0A238U5B0_9FLAO|nr:(deoxy)nucleoside triphosphate pyrophosphohydrolase [Tenacibaculum jejuense]SNR14282.1 NUDIX hydrolase [Tenacibaculum jejuense]